MQRPDCGRAPTGINMNLLITKFPKNSKVTSALYKVKTTKLLVLDFWYLYYKFPLEALYLSSFLLIFGIMSIKTGAVSCQKEKRSKMEDHTCKLHLSKKSTGRPSMKSKNWKSLLNFLLTSLMRSQSLKIFTQMNW